MICIKCENCIKDYMGKPYCFIGQFLIDDAVELTCDDFRSKEET